MKQQLRIKMCVSLMDKVTCINKENRSQSEFQHLIVMAWSRSITHTPIV